MTYPKHDRKRSPTAERTSTLGVYTMTAFDRRRFLAAAALQGLSSYESIADAAGVTHARLKQIAQGAIPPTETRSKIAAALGVSPVELWPECVRAEVA